MIFCSYFFFTYLRVYVKKIILFTAVMFADSNSIFFISNIILYELKATNKQKLGKNCDS